MIQHADLVIPCWVRLGGRIEQWIDKRLSSPYSRVNIAIPACEKLIPLSCQQRWNVPRIQLGSSDPGETRFNITCKSLRHPTEIRRRDWPYGGEWLVHATRASDRRRPGETRVDYFKRWLETPADQWGDAFAALRSILRERIIHASRLTGPMGQNYTSLSRLPIGSLAGPRTYRRGRHQWDYEPFGIAFQPGVLKQLGGQPVIYETQSASANCSHVKRKAQLAGADPYRLPERWSHEKEWWVPGPIDLSSLDTEDWFPFVPDQSYANQLAGLGVQRFIVAGTSDHEVKNRPNNQH